MNGAEIFVYTLAGRAEVGAEWDGATTSGKWSDALDVAARHLRTKVPIMKSGSPGGGADRREFADGSYWVAVPVRDTTKNQWGIMCSLWRITELTSSKMVAPPPVPTKEPDCRCSMRDLASGDHPQDCPWIRWRKGKR